MSGRYKFLAIGLVCFALAVVSAIINVLMLTTVCMYWSGLFIGRYLEASNE